MGLVSEIGKELAEQLKESATPELPSIRELARTFSVSPVTMGKVLHLLADQGLIRLHRGRRAVTSAHADRSGAHNRASQSALKLAEDIKEEIEEGTLKRGHYLPKVRMYSMSRNMSDSAVCDAYRLLAENNLAHKSGRHWVVGPSPSESRSPVRGRITMSLRPEVLIVVPDLSTWTGYFEHTGPQRLFWELISELDRYDVGYFIGVPNEDPAYSVPNGKREIADAIRQQGNRYQGTIVAAPVGHGSLEREPLLQWIKFLGTFKKPVIWLDTFDQEPDLDRRLADFPHYYRCHFSEKAIVATALDAVHALGHRTVAAFNNIMLSNDHWHRKRMALLAAQAQSYQPPIEFLQLKQDEDFWAEKSFLDYEAACWYLLLPKGHGKGWFSRTGPFKTKPDITQLRSPLGPLDPSKVTLGRLSPAGLSEHVPSLATLVLNTAATAVVALNDWFASCYHMWFRQMGIRVPEDISIVSFDNEPIQAHHPLTTVDFGLESLGYYAAHILIGDLPIRSDRWGNIACKPKLMDRGSLGPPRYGRTRLRR